MTISFFTRCAVALSLLLHATGAMAQNATLVADNHEGTVAKSNTRKMKLKASSGIRLTCGAQK